MVYHAPQSAPPFRLTANELEMLAKVAAHKRAEISSVIRRSEREYDIEFNGWDGKMRCNFSSWLPLAAIGCVDWTGEEYAEMSDYPMMVAEGDWSGIRDSNEGAVWRMFKKALVDMLLSPEHD